MTDNIDTEQEAAVLAEMQSMFNDVGIRAVFRDIDLSDHNSNTYEFEIPVDEDPTEPVPEGKEMPRTGLSHQKETVTFEKFGFEISDEADEEDIEDNVEMLYASIASHAADKLYDNVCISWASNDNRLGLVRDAIAESRSTVLDSDIAVVPQILGESIAEEDPTREWDEIREDMSGEFGVEIVTDKYNVLRGSDILVADSNMLGYEAVRTFPETKSYVEYEEHDPRFPETQVPEDEREVRQEIVQTYLRTGFAVLDGDKANIVRFGHV